MEGRCSCSSVSTLPSNACGDVMGLVCVSVQDNVPAQVMDRLWIGSIHAAFNQDSMQDRGITHVSEYSPRLAAGSCCAERKGPLVSSRLHTTWDLRTAKNGRYRQKCGLCKTFE